MDATGWDERYGAQEPVWGEQPSVFVAEALGTTPPGRALDLAAGEGRHAVWLASLGWHVEAVDYSSVGLSRAQEWAKAQGVADRLVTVEADLVDFVPAPGGFDAVILAYVQLPRFERIAVIPSAARAVAVGGLLVVVAHDSSNLADGHGGPPDPSVLYTPQEVLSDLEAGPYEWEILRGEVALREVAGAERPARDAVVVARRVG